MNVSFVKQIKNYYLPTIIIVFFIPQESQPYWNN